MALLTVAKILLTGTIEAPVAADAIGDTWLNTGKEYIKVVNASGGDVTVTPVVQGTISTGEVITPTPIVISTGDSQLIGPFAPSTYNDSATNLASVTYSAETSVTVQVFQLPAVVNATISNT